MWSFCRRTGVQTIAEVDQPISKFSSPFPDYTHPVHMRKEKKKRCVPKRRTNIAWDQKLQSTPLSPGTDSAPYPALASLTKGSSPANRTTRVAAFSSTAPRTPSSTQARWLPWAGSEQLTSRIPTRASIVYQSAHLWPYLPPMALGSPEQILTHSPPFSLKTLTMASSWITSNNQELN